MNTTILFLLALARSYHHGVLRCVVAGAGVPVGNGGAVATVLAHPRPIKGNLVGRCKKCKAGACYTGAVRVLATFEIDGASRQDDVAVVGDRILLPSMEGGFRTRCGCGNGITVRSVEGKFTAHVCNAKCMGSTGPACECSCGGKNHGRAFAS